MHAASVEATASPPDETFEVYEEARPAGLLRRFVTTARHLFGLAAGGLHAWQLAGPLPKGRLRRGMLRLAVALTHRFVDRSLLSEPFPRQLRRRLERLGPTYIKLGQILSLREDLLPPSLTTELKGLLDRLPSVPYERFLELLRQGLGRDPEELFTYIETHPLGSASIGQLHRAGTRDGRAVILKVVKPGIRATLERDVVLLRFLGVVLDLFFARYRPRQMIAEFCHYTLREVDLELEADHAETFAAHFRDEPDIVFPRIDRAYSSRDVLCMEFLRGVRPDSPEAQELGSAGRERVIDLGAAAIIRMLYRDGFFHADLHPGNLLVLPGPKCGFIDLGMVGRFDEDLRKRLLYYYYCLVVGDVENAARYLAAIARPSRRGDAQGFRREVEEVCRRFALASERGDLSLGRLVMESVSRGARYGMYFPVEMVLMVKAILTFEAVGQLLQPGLDVAAVSRRHVNRIFLQQFSPLRIARETLRGAPELVDALIKAPALVTEGIRFLEQSTRQPVEHPLTGIRGTLYAGFCLVAGAIVLAAGGPPEVAVVLLGASVLLAIQRES